MTTQQSIDKQLSDEYEKFVNSRYSGKIPIPENIIDLFKVAIMTVSPNAHGIDFNKIKGIVKKNNSELVIGDLSDMITMILNSPPKNFYDNRFDVAVESIISFKKFEIAFTLYVREFNSSLQQKKITLLSLANAGRGKGLSIVN